MAEWLVVLSEDNWAICSRVGLLGLGRNGRRRLNRMGQGDLVWIYVNKKYVHKQTPRVRRLRAVARLLGPTRHLEKPPWRGRAEERFAFARPIKIVRTIDASGDILQKLSFGGNNTGWGIRLLNAPLALTRDDVARLEKVSS